MLYYRAIRSLSHNLLVHSANIQTVDSSQAHKPLFLVPYGRDRSFIDRKDIFTSIDKQMVSNRRVALSGIGGVGSVILNSFYCSQ